MKIVVGKNGLYYYQYVNYYRIYLLLLENGVFMF